LNQQERSVLHDRAAHRHRPEFFLRLNIFHEQMDVPHRDARAVRRRELRASRQHRNRRGDQEEQTSNFHGSIFHWVFLFSSQAGPQHTSNRLRMQFLGPAGSVTLSICLAQTNLKLQIGRSDLLALMKELQVAQPELLQRGLQALKHQWLKPLNPQS